MVSLSQIFSWFKTGAIPTESQFKQTWESFWHKSEKIPGTAMISLPARDKDNNFIDVRIWIGMTDDLPTPEERRGTKTLYVVLENNAEL